MVNGQSDNPIKMDENWYPHDLGNPHIHRFNRDKLDDGWPESVEEQGLLLLVWRHHIRKQYIKDVL